MTERTEKIIWNGELSTWRRLALRGFAYLSPGLLWLLGLLVLPGIALIFLSFARRGEYGNVIWSFTLHNYNSLLGFGPFGWTADNLMIIWRSIVVAFVTTVVCIVMAYPVAFFIASRPKSSRYLWLILVIVPQWTNTVIRAYAWFLLLAPGTPLARLATLLKLIPAGGSLYPSAFAVYLGMVSMYLPFIILPLYASVEQLDWSLVEAARDLYGTPLRVFMQAILPQTAPGLMAGTILTFVPAMGSFVVPDLLGGSKYMLLGNLIEQQFGASRNWPYGAAISMALMALTLVSLVYFKKADPGRKKEFDVL